VPVNPIAACEQLPRTRSGSGVASVVFGFGVATGVGVFTPDSANPADPDDLDAETAVDTSQTFYPAGDDSRP
jgi:hypothetical protein